MMNKALEVIEAKFLFSMSSEQIEVIVHPKSLVHSLVQFIDGSTIAQLANPDMSVPISFALAYPERIKINVPQLDPLSMGSLEFYKPDFGKFPCLSYAYDALDYGGDAMIRLNASNEIGVQAFLDGAIGFMDIAKVVACSLEQSSTVSPSSIEEILYQDAVARAHAKEYIDRIS
jgi:1-deoxy-D-xylulose-5-phosphate reductoisomerase